MERGMEVGREERMVGEKQIEREERREDRREKRWEESSQ